MAETNAWDHDLTLLREIVPHVTKSLGSDLYTLRMQACSDLVMAREQVTGDRIDQLCNLALQEVHEKPDIQKALVHFRAAIYRQLECANAPMPIT